MDSMVSCEYNLERITLKSEISDFIKLRETRMRKNYNFIVKQRAPRFKLGRC